MPGRIYVSLLADDRRPVDGPDIGTGHGYAVAVPEHCRVEFRRLLVQEFTDVVNTVVGNVFIVNADLTVGDMQAVVRALVDGQGLDVEVVYVDEMNWEAISHHLQYPAAVA